MKKMFRYLASFLLVASAAIGQTAIPNPVFSGTVTFNQSVTNGSATLPPTLLGGGIPSSSTVLFGDGQWRLSTSTIPSISGLSGYILSNNGIGLLWTNSYIGSISGTSGQINAVTSGNATTLSLPANLTGLASITALRNLSVSGVAGNTVVYVQGYYAPGDGGGGYYALSTGSSASDNGGTIIAPAVGSGRWLFGGAGATVKTFGAKGDGVTDDTVALQAAITAIGAGAAKGGYIVKFPAGVYVISATLVIGGGRVELRGEAPQGSNATQLLKTGAYANVDFIDAGTSIVDTFSMEYIQLQGDGTSGTGNGVTLGNTSTFVADCRIENCWFNQMPNACINMVNVGGYHISNNGMEQSAYGIYKNTTVTGAQGNNVIENNRFYADNDAIFIGFSQHDMIVGNHFDSCGGANDTSGAIVLSTNGSEIRGESIAANNFRADYNDILCTGTASKASHVGVTVNSVTANHSDFAQRHFFYSNSSDGMGVIGNYINDAGQQTTNTFGAIDLEGTTANTTVSDNVSQYAAGVTPAYGLIIGSGTSNTNIGPNQFVGQSGTISFGNSSYTYMISGQENTFTPTMTGGSSAGTTTYTNQIGRYQRIGTWVRFSLRVTWTGATGTGLMQIGALPFQSNATSNLLQAITIGYATLAAGDTTSLNGYIPFGATYCIINKYSAGSSSALNVETTGDLVISGNYGL